MTIGRGDGPTDTVEIEWQFDALDLRPAARWLAGLAAGSIVIGPLGPITALARPAVIQDDVYLDTEDWRIAQAGYVLRVRHAKDKQQVTLKALSKLASIEAAPKRRREVTEPFGGSPGQWIEQNGPVGWRVAALIGRRPLLAVLEVQTRRRPFILHLGGDDVAEVALDETAIAIDDQNPMRLLRVEVEVGGPWVEKLEPLVEDLRRAAGLTPAALSKFEAGVLARGYVIPTQVNLGPTGVTSTSSIGVVADAVVRLHLGALLAHEAGTRLGEDNEELHDMRVASRRLRAALDVFVDVLPPQFRALAPELRWLADVLGAVRDLDVQLDGLDDAPQWHRIWSMSSTGDSAVEELRSVMEREREANRVVLLQALESARYERLTTGLMALAQQGAGQRSAIGHLPARAIAPGLVERRHRSAVKAARRARSSGDAADFHRLRIRCKRLRYATEFVQELYGEPATQFIRQLSKLQDLLGGLQDAQVAIDRLQSLATRSQPPLSRDAVFLMGTVAEETRRVSESLASRAEGRANVLRGEEWQCLAHELERLRDGDDRAGGGPTPSAYVTPIDAPAFPALHPERDALATDPVALGPAHRLPPELA
ncbi:MAG: CHAD domain-containing protein [Acidimicrobiales bacterium]